MGNRRRILLMPPINSQRESTLVFPKFGPYAVHYGSYTASNVTLTEAAVNGMIVRVQVKNAVQNGQIKRYKAFRTPPVKRMNNAQGKAPEQNPVNRTKVVKKYSYSRSPLTRLLVNFDKLAEMACALRLPSDSWKVNIVIDNELTPVFTFLCEKPAKSVTFYKNSPFFRILIHGVSVYLLGCPGTIDCIRDIEILLDIVHTVSLKDCMVAFLS